jgi:hypothetical protein
VTGPGSYRLQTLDAKTSATRGISTSSIDSTPSLSTTLGLKSARLLQDPFAVSGLRVQAQVFGLLYSKIQRSRLLTDLRLLRATKDSSSGLSRDHVLLDPAYTATNGSTALSCYAPLHHLAVGILRVLATTLVKRPWPSRCTSFSNKV